MADTVFTEVRYNLSSIVNYIDIGDIGLPDIQRPFVWKNNKVRDLLDSIYRGYPVGYLLFWQNGNVEQIGRTVGVDAKQKPARLLIVDGQQRLTCLYAVIKGIEVIREDYTKSHIRIAFNPLLEKFEVADAATDRDPTYISNISDIWRGSTLYAFITDFLEQLSQNREVTEEEKNQIQSSISKLESIQAFPFTALELSPEISEEAVAEVFVRINSEGKSLNQADFILTLMSVFWDEGRSQLEESCRAAREPSTGEASPFNYFITPSPDQLLRVSVMLGFKRARLQTVYSILRGKDLESEEFDVQRRESQFEALKKAQALTLNLNYWHDFMSCLRSAGFRSSRMITSNNALVFSYLLYLLARCEYNVERHEVRPLIAQWFFMSSLTGRYTTSAPESRMEFDLAQLRNVNTAEAFISLLHSVCESSLPDDFWTVTLPNHLASSSARTPGLSAFNASLILQQATALYSNIPLSDLLDPSINTPRHAVERHHLFPRAYLERNGVSGVRSTNQIANYAYIEWEDNSDISDKSPQEYVPSIEERFEPAVLNRMYKRHGLPNDWINMEYQDFLQARRELISNVIKDGYQILRDGSGIEDAPLVDVKTAIDEGESSEIEFKSTLRTNLHTGKQDPKMEYSIVKTIAGFLNTNGGTLMVGVSDDGTPVGIDVDGFENEDKLQLHLANLIRDRVGGQYHTYLNIHFAEYEEQRILAIECNKSSSPVYVKDGQEERFYIRTGPATSELTGYEMQTYIGRRFS